MADRVIGTCSVCGGDVVAYDGVWMSVSPPPADHCSRCGAVRAKGLVIQMIPVNPVYVPYVQTGVNAPLEYTLTSTHTTEAESFTYSTGAPTDDDSGS